MCLFNRIIHLAHAHISSIAMLCCLLGCVEEFLSLCWTYLLEREVTNLTIEEVLEVVPVRGFRIKLEWVLALLCKTWVETPQVPVSTLDSLCFLCLALAHCTLSLNAVVDTWSVSNHERWARISLCLSDGLQALSVVSTHSHLSHIHVAISGLHETEVFLSDALTTCCKLSNSTDWSSLGRLTTGIRINFCIEHEDVDVLARSESVVETSVTNIIRCAVTTNNPLASLHEIVREFGKLLADRATSVAASLNSRSEFRCCCLRSVCIFLASNPFFCCFLKLCRSVFLCKEFVEHCHNTASHLLVGYSHTQTIVAEVLEEGVRPCRTLTLIVLC